MRRRRARLGPSGQEDDERCTAHEAVRPLRVDARGALPARAPPEGFISVIAGFSFIGIMLGVATLIVVISVMNGFRKELLDKILGLNGHVIVQPIDAQLDRL